MYNMKYVYVYTHIHAQIHTHNLYDSNKPLKDMITIVGFPEKN